MLAASGQVAGTPVQERQEYRITVDDNGVMRRTDTGAEASYYGTNYTAPFAYSYRALGYLGKDRKATIDKDVYHIARMGQNAFRLHLWDAELADSAGNLLRNDHLDLLDYMIAAFEKRGIDIILTAQTNFGNGYPERNIDTGAFTYDYKKCEIHDNPQAQEIQERYLRQLAQHVNPYNGLSYAADNAIIAMEVNNEPCHSGTEAEITAYINRMASALRGAGFDKPILYNVTHNLDKTAAYYQADIDGTTYQWYPTGLVAGHERKGNLLAAFDDYNIAWRDTMPNYGKLAKVVYEFDPADVLYSHLYPAVARTFRKEGFQWITQFAYDPLPLAPFNTEYPTHYLNLVYTPAKALSMAVAAEAAKETPRGADYGNYPDNTTFGHTRISYEEDLSEFNAPETFIYTNNTATVPADMSRLRRVAGHGSSPAFGYGGSGAYFLDAVSDDTSGTVWRLEVMPDADLISDPFGNTSLLDAKTVAVNRAHPITVTLPSLGPAFHYRKIAGCAQDGVPAEGTAADKTFTVTPGVYLLANDAAKFDATMPETVAGNIGLAEYHAPDADPMPFTLLTPREHDASLDVVAVPEAWDFKFGKKKTSWDEEPVYVLTIEYKSTAGEGSVIVMRRYVANDIDRIPVEMEPKTVNVRFQPASGDVTASQLPEGTELAVVTREGYTWSVPVTPDANGEFSAPLTSFAPREGLVVPAPYPGMMKRTYPAGGKAPESVRDMEFVELIIPRCAGGASVYLPERIWVR